LAIVGDVGKTNGLDSKDNMQFMGTLPGTKLYVMNMMKYIPWNGDSYKNVNFVGYCGS